MESTEFNNIECGAYLLFKEISMFLRFWHKQWNKGYIITTWNNEGIRLGCEIRYIYSLMYMKLIFLQLDSPIWW